MNKCFLAIIFISVVVSSYSQNKTKIIKTDFSGIAETKIFQIAYENKTKENSSFEFGIGFGTEEDVNFYGLSTQIRFFPYNDKFNTPFGFHFGTRVLAIYAETRESTWTGTKDSSLGFELDAITGYQFIVNNVLTIDPYIGYGLAVVNNQTETGFVWGFTFGVAF